MRTVFISVLLASSLVACKQPPNELANDAPPTSTVETRSAPLPSATFEPANDKSGGKKAPRQWLKGTVALGDTGYSITLPDGFEIAAGEIAGFWDVEGVYEHVGPIPHRGRVAALMASYASMSKESETITSVCGKDRQGLLVAPIAGNGRLVKCHGESVQMAIPGMKIVTHKIRVAVPLDENRSDSKRSLDCSYEADQPNLIGFTEKVCRSLKKAR